MFYTPKLKQRQIIDFQLLIAVLFVVWEGIEPPTHRFSVYCSTN